MVQSFNVKLGLRSCAIMAAACACGLGLMAEAAEAAELHVPRQYPTIQSALDAAAAGDTILVGPGVYVEQLAVSKPVQLVSTHGAEATVVAIVESSLFVHAQSIGTLFQGFTFHAPELEGFGALWINANHFEMVECVVENCDLSGVYVQAMEPGEITFTSCVFRNNHTGGLGGGAVKQSSLSNSSLVFDECVFSGNSSTGDGGALWIEKGSFVSCHFEGNDGGSDEGSSAKKGGAVYVLGSSSFESCTFVGNTNGAIAAAGFERPAVLSMIDCEFIENSGGAGGGAVHCIEATVSVESCLFHANTSNDDGGALRVGGTTTVTGSVFSANSAFRGGAIFAIGAANVVVTDSEFLGNTASFLGGGIALSPMTTSLEILGCTIEGNVAPVGGGVHVMSGAGASATISESLICGNESDNVDGAYSDGGGNTICEDFADADLNEDGRVDGADLGLFLAWWGQPQADLDNNPGTVSADLELLLEAWTG